MRSSRWVGLVVMFVIGAGLVGVDSAIAQGKDKVKDLIVGKWEADDPKAKDVGGVVIEFGKDGSLTMDVGKLQIKGKYKFIAEDTLEATVELNGKKDTTKMKVEVTKDSLVTTELEGKKDVTKFKRVVAKK